MLIYANSRTGKFIKKGKIFRNEFSEGVRNLLSSYTKAINKQQGKSGNLFQQNTKCKCLTSGSTNYGITCFHYIHQNAWKAGLVKRMEDWPYSSFVDFMGLRNGTLCNKSLAMELLDLKEETFYKDSYGAIDKNKIDLLF